MKKGKRSKVYFIIVLFKYVYSLFLRNKSLYVIEFSDHKQYITAKDKENAIDEVLQYYTLDYLSKEVDAENDFKTFMSKRIRKFKIF